MDGYELASRLVVQPGGGRGDGRPIQRPVLIALTGYGREHDRQRSRDAGFDHHLVKPVSPATLLELLDRSAQHGR